MTQLKTPVSSKGLFDLLYQSYVPRIINAAIEIDLFQALSKKGMTLVQLIKSLKIKAIITHALLDVLIAVNLVEKEGEVYSLTPAARDFLLTEAKKNQIDAVKAYSGSSGPFDSLVQVLCKGPAPFNPNMWSSPKAVLDMEQQQKGGGYPGCPLLCQGLARI
ncbi:MAG: hypothetical protein HUK40_04070 [Desulfobacter sp.]|nr:hypothetical protein [Desulfobacter sp.]